MESAANHSKKAIRQYILQLRRRLSSEEVAGYSKQLVQHVSALQEQAGKAERLAFYTSHRNEINPYFLLEHFLAQGKHCYLPCLHDDADSPLIFARYQVGGALVPNRYGILEPAAGTPRCEINELDIVFLPLVAFDHSGNRLGMGAGYYDRTLALLPRVLAKRPYLCGLAYDFQCIESLLMEAWDIPLDGVMTPSSFWHFK